MGRGGATPERAASPPPPAPRSPSAATHAATLALFAALSASAHAAIEDCNADSHVRALHPHTVTDPEHARAIWLDRRHLRWPGVDGGRFLLQHSAQGTIHVADDGRLVGADATIELETVPAPASLAQFPHLAAGVDLRLPDGVAIDTLARGQLLLAREDADGRTLELTRTQLAAALDDRYGAATEADDLGSTVSAGHSAFALWAPTARAVGLCVYADGRGAATQHVEAHRDDATGIWRTHVDGDLAGHYYTWLVDVYAPGHGLVRNRVTDPYSISLTTNSTRSWIGRLDAAAVTPPGWTEARRPDRVQAMTDMVIYELHVRDFSINDETVPARDRGNYTAFTHAQSDGMRHLRALAEAGVTDVHLLPVFDIATIPEAGCITPTIPDAAPDATAQQEVIARYKDRDCFNWGYDPQHYTAPEGSYATDPGDGAVRLFEFRQMVMALHAAGLRVGMDVVYNHTSHAGQHAKSVLDRIVPGYYHRLDADGAITQSTCCDNTATEHRMMAKLMIDSVVVWARDHRIDSFRFDLMGHQPRAAMLELQQRVNRAAGRHVELIGEGWDFGEVASNARFVQASQRELAGTGIATFSDRARDAVRGGGCCDSGEALVASQGWASGLHTAPNAFNADQNRRDDLLRSADLVRVGLAGTIRDYVMTAHDGHERPLSALDYAHGPAGYVAEPGEVVNYVENHDNPTLFDILALRLPADTPRDERARAQIVALAVVAFSQGIAYFHAGGEILRSKSLDKNSYDSGDWFNRLDWTLTDNGFGAGLPPAWDNQDSWEVMRPVLANPRIRPGRDEIRWTREAFLDLLRIRAGTTLLRLRTADDVKARLRLLNTGPAQNPALLVGHVDGDGYPGAGFRELVYFINADVGEARLDTPSLSGRDWVLHPVHRRPDAADRRAADAARYDAEHARFVIPARTAVVFVVE